MLFKDCIAALEQIAPTALKEEWDNVGLMVGDRNATVNGILFALDVTDEVIEEAVSLGCNLIVSHHPLIFKPLNCLDREKDEKLFRLIEEGIHVYSMHTNLDSAEHGVNACLAECFELQDVQVLCGEENTGLGRIGRLWESMTFEQFLSLVKSTLQLGSVRYVGDLDRAVRTIAVLGGAGGEYLQDAIREGADVFVTSEIKHHIALFAKEKGIGLVDAGHFATEQIVLEPLMAQLCSQLPVPMYLSKRQKGVIETI